jgi:hypothetical protein
VKPSNFSPKDREQSKGLFPGKRVLLIDPDVMVPDTAIAGSLTRAFQSDVANLLDDSFDVVMWMHGIQRLSRADAVQMIALLKSVVKPGGALYLSVPSLEWACRHVLTDRPNPAVLVHMYGVQDKPGNFHNSGWTLRLIRRTLTEAGWKIREARRETYQIQIGNEVFEADQHYIEAVPGETAPDLEGTVE